MRENVGSTPTTIVMNNKRQRTWFVRNMWTKRLYGVIRVEPDLDTDEVIKLARQKYWMQCHSRNIEIFNSNVPFKEPESFRDEWMEHGY